MIILPFTKWIRDTVTNLSHDLENSSNILGEWWKFQSKW
jgi:hypothetical protein